ncbi:MAG: hypothetical protein JWN25_2231 [Verrucomicrobiales bacterium]|nr:hypothetical protein [Verrucomicrobiales bacterium]
MARPSYLLSCALLLILMHGMDARGQMMYEVSLLDEAGYFRWTRRFWTHKRFPGSVELAQKIERKNRAQN